MILSKSNYMIGLQCPRYLWIKINKPEKIPEPDMEVQHRFDQGHLLEEYAHKLYPEGETISSENFKENLENTKELLKKRKTLFEAGILADSLFSRADILIPVKKNKWDIVEIKGSSRVKDEHILDVAFQKYVYMKAGLNIRKCFLMHVNTDYVKKGNINPKKLLEKEDITDKVDKAIKDVESNIKKVFEVLRLKKAPDFQLEDISNSFYDNPIIDEFMESLPKGSVFELYRGGKKCVELFGQEICLLSEIPEEYKLTGHQAIQRKCAKTGKPHINKKKIKEFLDKLEYPLYFMDFEAFSSVIPVFEGTRPYEQIPFQYSLHVVKSKGAEAEHISFLAKGPKDQREEFYSSLKKDLKDKGSILVYNQSFEKRILKKSSKDMEDIMERIVDLLIPFRKFYYYNPKQKGSASLKNVLPALIGKDPYKELEINNGAAASIEYMNVTFGDEPEEKVYDDLEKYCGLDTESMIWILDKLWKMV